MPPASSVGKNQKSTEGKVIYVLGNPQRDVGDWLPLINKPDTIATYSIPTATCQQQLTTPNNACPCVRACRPEVPQYRKEKNCATTTARTTWLIEREGERERETEREKERGKKVDVKNKRTNSQEQVCKANSHRTAFHTALRSSPESRLIFGWRL